MASPPPSLPCDADCYTEQYILQIGIPVGIIAFIAICCLCYGCCSTSPDGSCYDDVVNWRGDGVSAEYGGLEPTSLGWLHGSLSEARAARRHRRDAIPRGARELASW